MNWTTAVRLAIVCFCAVGCSGSQAAPSTVRRELGIGCGMELDGYQCEATLVTEGQATTHQVTRFARWATSDTSIATVNDAGFVTVLKTEEVGIRATYEDVQAFISLKMQAGGLRYFHRALSGWLTDAQTNEKLRGVTVQVMDGPNAGRTVQGGDDGAYQMYELQPGTFRVRFTKTGYRTLDRSAVLPGDRLVSLDAALTRDSP